MSLTLIIVVITVIVSLAAMNNGELMNKLMLWPRLMNNPSEYYRLITSGFVHADYMHLGFNMFALYSFGNYMEQVFAVYLGSQYLFIILYLTGIVAASLPSYMKHRHDNYFRSLGASGGVSAVMFAFIYFAPWSKILILFIPMPGIVFGIIYLVYSAYAQKKGHDNIGHDAHFWGAVYGFLFTLLFEPSHGRIFIEQLMHPQF
jgi:membrane associated rhomboid family serine protease